MSKATVLIETYWNVKFFAKKEVDRLLRVLIETYWNVKDSVRALV